MCPHTSAPWGRGRRTQNRRTTGHGAVRRQAGGTAEISRGAPYLLKNSAFIAGFSCLSIALFGPANHPELHLSEKELKALQPRIYIRLLIVVALTAVLLFFRPDWGACTAFGVFAAALLLVISLQGYGAQ